VGSSLFQRSIAVESVGAGTYAADLGRQWNCPIVPQGGIVAATAARAMEAELGEPTQILRSLNAVFAGPVQEGEVVIEVAVLRRGRSMSQLRVALRNPGTTTGFDAFAVFGTEREGFTFTDAVVPDGVTPAHECPSYRDPVPAEFEADFSDRVPFTFWEHVEGRPTLGHAPWEEYEPVTSLRAQWYRFDDPPRTDDGAWDPLAVMALCDTMPGAVGERLPAEERRRRWIPPSADFTVHMLGEARSEWILAVNRARHAGEGYASADMEIWDVESGPARLVAYATQTMVFSFPK